MNNIFFKITLIFSITIILNSCGNSFSDAGKVLRNQKITNKDEFLVKKREPLVLPPDYDMIPTPGSIKEKKDDGIDKILKIPEEKKNKSNNSSSLEKTILNEINK